MARVRENLNDYVKQLERWAKEKGVDDDPLVISTLDRYRTQVAVMEELKITIAELGTTIKKTYVKGQENICINPTIKEYNNTANAANGTVQTLMKLIRDLPAKEKESKLDGFLEAANA